MHGRLSALQHDRGGLFRGQPQRIAVVRYHSLAVEERSLPPELAVSARSSDGAVMACTALIH
jgi:anthranilate/para-aminobenzoate synthase component II